MKALDVPLENEVPDALSAVRMMASRSGEELAEIAEVIARIHRLIRRFSFTTLSRECAKEAQRQDKALNKLVTLIVEKMLERATEAQPEKQ